LGQQLNKEKITVFFSRNTKHERELILSLASIPATQRYDKYLGLPALVGKSRMGEFKSIIDRVCGGVSDWKTKFLSQAEKEILLKAVVQAIPTYIMSIFLLPKALYKENDKKIHLMSWVKIERSKVEGGMGFQHLTCFNVALLAKQCWRLLQNPDSLVAQIIKAKYYDHESFWDAKIGSRPSYAWRSLLSAKELLHEEMIWRIGNGLSVKIWGDRWISRPSSDPNAM
jgi:hypothetical protein